MSDKLSFNLRIWRQRSADSKGRLETYQITDITPDMSILEALDALNEDLTRKDEDPVAFDSDCREGICGMCGLVIEGVAHGPHLATTTCELRMRHFTNGSTITIEPFRATPFPVIKDLVVDRSAFDRIIAKGGYVSVNTGAAAEANMIPVAKDNAEKSMDAAACIGCGACVASCPNASASLFVSAKIAQLAFLPQGNAERNRRALRMIEQMDMENFGACSNHGECEAVCPKEISITHIALLRREYFKAALK